MTSTTSQIAQHLNVLESAVIRVEEWAHVMFAVVKGIGARFVSKKIIVKMNTPIKAALISKMSTVIAQVEEAPTAYKNAAIALIKKAIAQVEATPERDLNKGLAKDYVSGMLILQEMFSDEVKNLNNYL